MSKAAHTWQRLITKGECWFEGGEEIGGGFFSSQHDNIAEIRVLLVKYVGVLKY